MEVSMGELIEFRDLAPSLQSSDRPTGLNEVSPSIKRSDGKGHPTEIRGDALSGTSLISAP